MTTPANYSFGANDAFQAGHTPLTNPGRANSSSITLNDTASPGDAALDAASGRWNAMSPHGVIQSAVGGSAPAQTDMGVAFGQQAVGNTSNADMVQTSFSREMMAGAGSIGANDGAA